MDTTITNIQTILKENQLDAILIHSPSNKQYINSLRGSGVRALITMNNIYQIMDGRYVNEAKKVTPQFDMLVYPQGSSYLDKLKEILPNQARLGIELNHMNAKDYIQLQTLDAKLEPIDLKLLQMRMVKTSQELQKIELACKITDEIFQETLAHIRLGMKEYEIAAYLNYLALKKGASKMAFDTIVASGTRGSMPHGRPSDKCIQKHEMITIDFGITYQGYQSDMTRTICMGTPTTKMKEVYECVKKAQQAGIDFIQCGVSGKEVDAHVRSIIDSFGYGEYFTHGLGHGIGIGEGELPLLNAYSDTILKNGMVMSCEPGIYIPDVGGVRIEDDVALINDQAVVFNKTTKDLIVLEG